MDRPGVRQVQESSREQRKKMDDTGCEICGAPTTPAAKGKVKGEGEAGEARGDQQREVGWNECNDTTTGKAERGSRG